MSKEKLNKMIMEICENLGFEIGGSMPPWMFDLNGVWCDARIIKAVYNRVVKGK